MAALTCASSAAAFQETPSAWVDGCVNSVKPPATVTLPDRSAYCGPKTGDIDRYGAWYSVHLDLGDLLTLSMVTDGEIDVSGGYFWPPVAPQEEITGLGRLACPTPTVLAHEGDWSMQCAAPRTGTYLVGIGFGDGMVKFNVEPSHRLSRHETCHVGGAPLVPFRRAQLATASACPGGASFARIKVARSGATAVFEWHIYDGCDACTSSHSFNDVDQRTFGVFPPGTTQFNIDNVKRVPCTTNNYVVVQTDAFSVCSFRRPGRYLVRWEAVADWRVRLK
jgi:hypothetical protein